jgi:hypothetical protein
VNKHFLITCYVCLLFCSCGHVTELTLVISGPLIQEQALKFAKDLGVDQFKASNGWLQFFLKRHSIVFRLVTDVDMMH